MSAMDQMLSLGLCVLFVFCMVLAAMLHRAHKTIEEATVSLNLATKLSMRGRPTAYRDYAA